MPGTGDSETGSNAGSNFGIFRYNDAGILVDQPFGITRSSGLITIGPGGLSVGGQIATTGSANIVSGGGVRSANGVYGGLGSVTI